MKYEISVAKQIEFLKNKLATDIRWSERALLRIFNAQTETEQAYNETHCFNKVGFTHADAKFLTICAKTMIKYGHVSENQVPYVTKKMTKYATQLFNSDIFNHDKMIAIMKNN